MKAATGELNLTVITIVAVVAVIGIFWLMFPTIKENIEEQWKGMTDKGAARDSANEASGTYIVIDDYVATIK